MSYFSAPQCSKFYKAKLVKIYSYHDTNFHHCTQGGEDRDPCFFVSILRNVLENMLVCKDVYMHVHVRQYIFTYIWYTALFTLLFSSKKSSKHRF